jgi:hypothetical protein
MRTFYGRDLRRPFPKGLSLTASRMTRFDGTPFLGDATSWSVSIDASDDCLVTLQRPAVRLHHGHRRLCRLQVDAPAFEVAGNCMRAHKARVIRGGGGDGDAAAGSDGQGRTAAADGGSGRRGRPPRQSLLRDAPGDLPDQAGRDRPPRRGPAAPSSRSRTFGHEDLFRPGAGRDRARRSDRLGRDRHLLRPPIFLWGGHDPLTLPATPATETYQPLGDRGFAQLTTGVARRHRAERHHHAVGGRPRGAGSAGRRRSQARAVRHPPADLRRHRPDPARAYVFTRGRIDQVLPVESIGGEASIQVMIETAARGLGRRGGRMRSDADQRLINPTDGFFKNVSFAAKRRSTGAASARRPQGGAAAAAVAGRRRSKTFLFGGAGQPTAMRERDMTRCSLYLEQRGPMPHAFGRRPTTACRSSPARSRRRPGGPLGRLSWKTNVRALRLLKARRRRRSGAGQEVRAHRAGAWRSAATSARLPHDGWACTRCWSKG